MPKGYGLILLTVVGWTSLTAQVQMPKDGKVAARGQKQQGPTETATAITDAGISEKRDPGCEPGNDDRHSDLCAQWKAADAANGSFWLGVVGAAIGFLTLAAAAFAAFYAKKAAEETLRSANFADEAIKQSRETAELELRAYLFPEDARLTLSRGSQSSICSISIPMRNSGQTPAKLVFYQISARYFSPRTIPVIMGDQTSKWRDTIKVTTNVQQLIGPNGRTLIPLETSIVPHHFDHQVGRVGVMHEQPRTVIEVRLEWSYDDYINRRWSEIAVFTSANVKWDTLHKLEITLPQTEAKVANRLAT